MLLFACWWNHDLPDWGVYVRNRRQWIFSLNINISDHEPDPHHIVWSDGNIDNIKQVKFQLVVLKTVFSITNCCSVSLDWGYSMIRRIPDLFPVSVIRVTSCSAMTGQQLTEYAENVNRYRTISDPRLFVFVNTTPARTIRVLGKQWTLSQSVCYRSRSSEWCYILTIVTSLLHRPHHIHVMLPMWSEIRTNTYTKW